MNWDKISNALEIIDRIAYPKRNSWDEGASLQAFAEEIMGKWSHDELCEAIKLTKHTP